MKHEKLHWQRVVPVTKGNQTFLTDRLKSYQSSLKTYTPVLATYNSNSTNVKESVASVTQLAKDFVENSQRLIEKGQYDSLQKECEKNPHLCATLVKYINIEDAIQNHRSDLLLALMCANRFLLDHISQQLTDKKKQHYLERLLTYKQLFTESSSSLLDCIPYFDKPIPSNEIEQLSALKRKSWLGGYWIDSSKIKLLKSQKGELTVLHSAIVNQDVELFSIALKAVELARKRSLKSFTQVFGYKSLDIQDKDGLTPLHYLCRFKAMNWATNLQDANAYLNSVVRKPLDFSMQDNVGNNALHHAVLSQDIDTVKQLITYIKSHHRYLKNSLNDVLEANHAKKSPIQLAFDLKLWPIFIELINENLYTQADMQEYKEALPILIQQHEYWALDTLCGFLNDYSTYRFNKQSLGHIAVQSSNYRALHILLHPLSKEERLNFVQLQDGNKNTMFDLLKTHLDKIPKDNRSSFNVAHTENLEKIARLLVQYDGAAKRWVSKQSWSYSYRFNQDFEHELKQTLTYPTLTKINLYGETVFYAGTTLIISQNPILAAEVAAQCYLTGDVFEKTNKLIGLAPTGNPKLETIKKGAQKGLNIISWHQNTLYRSTKLGFAKATAYFLSTSLGKQSVKSIAGWFGFENSYMKTLEASAGIYFASENLLGGKLIAPMLGEIMPVSIESFLYEHYGVPTLNQLAGDVLKAANEFAEQYLGINPARAIIHSYITFRKTIGKLANDETELYLKMLVMTNEELMEYYYGDPEYFQSLISSYHGDDVVELAFELSTGYEDKPTMVAQILAIWVVGYYASFENLTKEQRETLIQNYKQIFIDTQQNSDWDKSPKHYKQALSYKLRECIHGVECIVVQNLVDEYYKNGEDVSLLANKIINSLGFSESSNSKLEEGIKFWLADHCTNPTQLCEATRMLISSLCSPIQNMSETITFCQMFGFYVNEHTGRNIGQAIAEVMTVILYEGGQISHSEIWGTYSYLSYQCNHFYWSDHKENKANFRNNITSIFGAYYAGNSFDYRPQVKNLSATKEGKIFEQVKLQAPSNLNQAYCESLSKEYPELFEIEGFAECMMQALAKAGSNQQRVEAARNLILIFSTEQYIEPFLNNQPLTKEAANFNNQYLPRDVRAAFAVNWIAQALNESPGYANLTAQEMVDLSKLLSNEKKQDDFEESVFNILQDHCYTPGSMPTLHCGHDPAGFARIVEEQSHHYGENKWTNTHDMDTRRMSSADEPSGLAKALYRAKNKLTGREGGIRFQLGDNGIGQLNLFNLYGFNIPVFRVPTRQTHNNPQAQSQTHDILARPPIPEAFKTADQMLFEPQNQNTKQSQQDTLPIENRTVTNENTSQNDPNAIVKGCDREEAQMEQSEDPYPDFKDFLIKEVSPLVDQPLGMDSTLESLALIDSEVLSCVIDDLDEQSPSSGILSRALSTINPIPQAEAGTIVQACVVGAVAYAVGLILKPHDEDPQQIYPNPNPTEDEIRNEFEPYKGKDPSQDDLGSFDSGYRPHNEDAIDRLITPVEQEGPNYFGTTMPYPTPINSLFYLFRGNESLEKQITKKELPTTGEFAYQLPKKWRQPTLPIGELNGRKGFLDQNNNVWVKGPCHRYGCNDSHEWDVQLSSTGRNMFRPILGNVEYVNVSLDGSIRRKR